METKQIDLTQKEFTANGHRYKINGDLSVNRWNEFEKLQPRLGYGLDFESLHGKLKTWLKFTNEGKGVEAMNIIYNLLTSIDSKLENRQQTALEICALFINRDDEDPGKFDRETSEEKILDWKIEGYSMMSFFQLAANLVGGFVEALQEISQSTSEVAKAKNSRQKDDSKK